MTPQEFAKKIKAKYPQYENVDDVTLSQKMVEKYPAYASRVQIPESPEESKPPLGAFGREGQEFSTGFVKGGVRTLQNIGKGALKLLGVDTSKLGFKDELFKPETGTEKVGQVASDVVQFALPGGVITNATRGAGLFSRLLARAGTSGAVATAQEGEIGKGTALAVGAEAVFPVAGKALSVGKNVVSRVTRSLASGLSGVSGKAISEIIKNPRVAKETVKQIDLVGDSAVLEANARKILDGVSKVRREARQAFGRGLDELAQTDIDGTTFRASLQSVLDKFGVEGGKTARKLKNIEFDNPKNIKKASGLIDRLSNVELNGKALRKLADDIDGEKFKVITGSNEKASFNAFLNQLSGGLRDAITKSTDKLDEINKAFSQDIQLAEATQGILGKVKFKSLNEIRKVAERLETLFGKKGLSPDIIDDFLTRAGIEPGDFRASEATRQMSDLTFLSNAVGINPFEVVRNVSASIVPPQFVRDVAIKLGTTQDALGPILNKLPVASRAILLDMLLETTENE